MSGNVKHIKVKVFPEAAEDLLREEGDDSLTAYVKARARGGEANKAVLALLCKKFPDKSVRIRAGHQTRSKIIEVK